MSSKEEKIKTGQGITPGPWMYRPNPGSSKEDWTFHIDRQGTPGRMNWGILIAACWGHVSESAEANARLIAAAPALYEALRAIDRAFASGDLAWKRKRYADTDPYHPANVKMCAALALVSDNESAKRLSSDRGNDGPASESKSESV